ncbi:hypothetical protein H0H87_006229 [Tephrocybe sp. NHM501043]|nr:hypothetical protein H0H87_006229 [Tephrocybe sp. NHM501043]
MRALQARIALAKKNGTLSEEEAYAVGSPMRKLKSLFPNSPLEKHTPLDIFLSAPSPERPRTLVFRDLGAIESNWVATEFVLHYFEEEQIDHFLDQGFVVVKSAFTKKKAAEWTTNVWIRLGMDPNDPSTWDRERVHMPWHKRERVADFAPKAWDAIHDLLGGEDRIDEKSSAWGDSFIVNLGTDELQKAKESDRIDPRDLDNWHVDGDFFVRGPPAPQALLVIPIFSDIRPGGGGTVICPDGIPMIALYLAAHSEGVSPTGLSFTPSTSTFANPKDDPGYWSHLQEIKKCKKFIEVTGEIGDVILMHPLMLHTASKNYTRAPRIITNPPVALRHPFNFARKDPKEYSLVELKTLRALGVPRLDFRISTERRMIVPARMAFQNELLEVEKQRLAKAQAK